MLRVSPPRSEGGFTIIEVMIVVVVMGILSALAVNSFYQQAFRQAVQGEGKQILQFLNYANMHVKKTSDSTSIAIDNTGMRLMKSADCSGDQISSNEWDQGIELVDIGSSVTGLPAAIVSNGAGFGGNWDSCILLTSKVGNSIEEDGAIIIGNSRLPADEKYLIAIVKTSENIHFRTYVSIVGSDWTYRK